MKEIFVNYGKYNVWANKLLIDELTALSKSETEQAIVGSFPSVRKTVMHIWLAESVWIQRLQMAEKIIIPADDETQDFESICQEWLKTSQTLLTFTEKLHDDRGLEHEFYYTDLHGNHHKSKVWECLLHVSNHSTFHRGQLITFLRQLGKTKIPSTDFIAFSRKK